ncbi:MAG: peptidase U62 [Acidobacteria bacterium]|nr:peptidase U62 [Acidobacteriota bacterium]
MLSTVRNLCLWALIPVALAAAQPEPKLLDILAEELDRNFAVLKDKADPKAYYIAYEVVEQQNESVSASFGVVTSRGFPRHGRTLDVTVRVGDRKLDNYHTIAGQFAQFTAGIPLPIEDDPKAIKLRLWQETDRCYRLAAQRLINIRTNKEVKVADKEVSDDFSNEDPSTHVEPPAMVSFAGAEWTERVKKLSARFAKYPRIHSSGVTVAFSNEVKYFVNTEGARLAHGRPFSRVSVSAAGKARDGMDLSTFDAFTAADPKKLPKDGEIGKVVQRVADDLIGLLDAPVVESFVGPAILSGRAAGVFFHEIFGHRVEGHRLKDESDGQTFAKSVGQPVLPEFLSVTFDPTLKRVGDEDLNGWYLYDDEGVKGRKLRLVDNGILRTFLMSRTPIPGFPTSNGHGRREPGAEVVARQSNLIVEASRTVSDKKLKQMLIEEVKRQNKPYGFYFQEITGGFTNTGRRGIQAFKVIPLVVYRIYPDGNEELVRGADIVGTPLASFAKIIAATEKHEVFNGYCGAESGSVPVSAVAPAILVREIEIQKKESSRDLPPLLTPPMNPASGGGL